MIYNELKVRGINYRIHQEYTSDLFVGASISVDADTDMMTIAGTNGVIVSPISSNCRVSSGRY
jgi:hypothetical protein